MPTTLMNLTAQRGHLGYQILSSEPFAKVSRESYSDSRSADHITAGRPSFILLAKTLLQGAKPNLRNFLCLSGRLSTRTRQQFE